MWFVRSTRTVSRRNGGPVVLAGAGYLGCYTKTVRVFFPHRFFILGPVVTAQIPST
jgi:hypothetical protein